MTFGFILLFIVAVTTVATAFSVSPHAPTSTKSTTNLNMFGGAGAGSPTEDNPEEEDRMKKAAAAMGMPVEEYKLAMRAQKKLATDMDTTRVQGGSTDSVLIDRDINNPPKDLKVAITESAKSKGKTFIAEELVKALETAKVEAAKGRNKARIDMMEMIKNGSL
jgi:hypothetical protein